MQKALFRLQFCKIWLKMTKFEVNAIILDNEYGFTIMNTLTKDLCL